MSESPELVEELMNRLEDHYTAEELVDKLQLTTREIIEAFYDMILEKEWDL